MRLIVGLGNPGAEYAWTPHNLGFLVVDRLAERLHGLSFPPPQAIARKRMQRMRDYLRRLNEPFQVPKWRPEAQSYIMPLLFGHQRLVLAKPQTFMNLSGAAVRNLVERTEAAPADVIVVVDDVALPWGMLRIRERGTAGGHNGLKSIIGALGTDEFVRIRMGIRPEHPVGDLAAYVLHPMRKAELEDAAEMVDLTADAVEMVLREGVGRAMSRFNRRVEPPREAAPDELPENEQ